MVFLSLLKKPPQGVTNGDAFESIFKGYIWIIRTIHNHLVKMITSEKKTYFIYNSYTHNPILH